MSSPTWEGPLTPPATAGWKEGETAFEWPGQEEGDVVGHPGPGAPVFGPWPLPEPIAFIEVSSESEPEEAGASDIAPTSPQYAPATPPGY